MKKIVNHKVYDINNNLISDEDIEIEVPDIDLPTISQQIGISIPELLTKVKEYLEK